MLAYAAAATGALLAWSALHRRRVERRVGARLPLGPDGIVRGAEGFTLDGDPRRAVLVLHGFGDTPQSVAGLARALHADGWTVRVPLLPGHGRTVRDFAASGAQAWLDAARAEMAAVGARHERVALVGQSMGAALSVVLAAEAPRLDALVLLAPYVTAPAVVRAAARAHVALGWLLPYIGSDGGAASIHDDEARAQALGYGVVTPRLLRELADVVDLAHRALPMVQAPTRVLLSRRDNRVGAEAAARAAERLGCRTREVVWLERSGHVIAVDRERELVFAHTRGWLAEHAPPAGPGA
ncbi:alpha/beta fold hydrolase [Roseisolibacter sp. H3M3-2]|uniref:alpha/beta hydrolase n=1 Tax=Roseisolibacter sp. H3M3-2 TaxID=3031323 RepID=UPI0023DA7799|nr:alpha/beta fold hydrolase [Roseisolibacter sp. H3M3-2]MDF1501775.1 alpha/beta fold hydrolase [Roseisolibacter sp. H3M3-2]